LRRGREAVPPQRRQITEGFSDGDRVRFRAEYVVGLFAAPLAGSEVGGWRRWGSTVATSHEEHTPSHLRHTVLLRQQTPGAAVYMISKITQNLEQAVEHAPIVVG
jgi:hypothetical protein